jgi:hypothetical protein
MTYASAAGYSNKITLTISKDTRTATVEIFVDSVTAEAPVVTVVDTGSAAQVDYSKFNMYSKFNARRRLDIAAHIDSPDGSTASWSIVDSSLDLNLLNPLTSVSSTLGTGLSVVNLALPANSLAAGTLYNFQISCISDTSGLSGSSFITVITNTAPQPGTMTISPLSGTEITTVFTAELSNWAETEGDYPITNRIVYHKSYPDNGRSADLVELVSQTETTLHEIKLPRGTELSANRRIVSAFVEDNAGAYSFVSQTVTVSSIQATNDQSRVASLLATSSALPSAQTLTAADASASVALVNSVAEALNAPNCTGPFAGKATCAELNRATCQYTARSCGRCLSGYPFGANKDANTPCFASIPTDPDQIPEKTCPSDCSGRGICKLSLVGDPGTAVGRCPVTSKDCQAICTCDNGFTGSGCQFSDSEQAEKSAARAQLTERFIAAQAYVDITPESIESTFQSIATLAAAAPDELSAATKASLLDIAQR